MGMPGMGLGPTPSPIMKTGLVVSTSGARFDALALKDDLELNLRKVANLGFDGVELAVRDPNSLDTAVLRTALRETGLPVCAIGTGEAYGEEGLSFTSSEALVRRKAVERIRSQVDFSGEIGCPIVIIGLIRGRASSDEPGRERAKVLVVDALKECAQYAFDKGIAFALEPINRYETNLVNTVDEGLSLLKEVGRENMGLLVDTFHMNIEEPSMEESLRKAGNLILHVHIADSNRWAPGCGHIDFPSILKVLEEAGYDGFLSAEILPKPNPDESARLAANYMSKLLTGRAL